MKNENIIKFNQSVTIQYVEASIVSCPIYVSLGKQEVLWGRDKGKSLILMKEPEGDMATERDEIYKRRWKGVTDFLHFHSIA